MDDVLLSLALVLLFVLVGGVFSASELALVTLRDAQVRRMAETDRRGDGAPHRGRVRRGGHDGRRRRP